MADRPPRRSRAGPVPGDPVLVRCGVVPSPLGSLVVVTRDGALCALEFGRAPRGLRARLASRLGPVVPRRAPVPAGLRRRLAAYWQGDVGALGAIPVDPAGTAWERRVWRALRRIPPGTTLTYGALARRLGRPGAARAVGAANARNPVAIVVPCHRLVGAGGALTGYGGGLRRKRWLLAHEGGKLTARRGGG